jgi:hypothetical protein
LQAFSEANRKLWLEAMDGKEPVRTWYSLFYTLGFFVLKITKYIWNFFRVMKNIKILSPEEQWLFWVPSVISVSGM